MFTGPKLTLTQEPSSLIPTADPRLLFWVAGVVLGVLALWVLYVTFTGETRARPSADEPSPSGDGPK